VKKKTKSGEKYVLSAIGPKNKVLWKSELGGFMSVQVPYFFQGYDVDSLIRAGRVHIKMVGKHKQNSQEIVVPIADWQGLHMNFFMHVNAMLLPLAAKLKTEDLVFDALLGEDKSNGR
jgi:hypothetical protein